MIKHVHAELMMQYAQDALTTNKPWELWEYQAQENARWVSLDNHPRWVISCKYRRKPKTININGFEVPEPVREPLELATSYYTPDLSAPEGYRIYTWSDINLDWKELNLGLIHLTKEAAILHSKALLSFTSKEPTQDESN